MLVDQEEEEEEEEEEEVPLRANDGDDFQNHVTLKPMFGKTLKPKSASADSI